MSIPFQIESFQKQLIDWFDTHKRLLPWRQEKHWYYIFLSEFLLQQTQVEQALPYFYKFIHAFPTIEHLAKTSEDDVLKLWAGLGYYSRARNLRKAAQKIVERFDGRFPLDYKDALSLPGIGPYTAAAILSIAFGKPHAVVDGNVIRVMSRLFSINEDVNDGKTRKYIESIVQKLLPEKEAGTFNEALMELGAVVCKPKNPRCLSCPVNTWCMAYKDGNPQAYPIKSAPAAKKRLFHYVFLIQNETDYLIVKRPDSGLLASMWEFPSVQTQKLTLAAPEIMTHLQKQYGIKGELIEQDMIRHHTYSHIRLQYMAVYVRTDDEHIKLGHYQSFIWEHFNRLSDYAIHNAHKKLLSWMASFKN
ncbi:MAG: A/G-specific adenine glycosylase [Caldithrix sp.]|nr:A/G-specific adenine glycosylase [Caldithrix sp.]